MKSITKKGVGPLIDSGGGQHNIEWLIPHTLTPAQYIGKDAYRFFPDFVIILELQNIEKTSNHYPRKYAKYHVFIPNEGC
jgi:hypothetical protein